MGGGAGRARGLRPAHPWEGRAYAAHALPLRAVPLARPRPLHRWRHYVPPGATGRHQPEDLGRDLAEGARRQGPHHRPRGHRHHLQLPRGLLRRHTLRLGTRATARLRPPDEPPYPAAREGRRCPGRRDGHDQSLLARLPPHPPRPRRRAGAERRGGGMPTATPGARSSTRRATSSTRASRARGCSTSGRPPSAGIRRSGARATSSTSARAASSGSAAARASSTSASARSGARPRRPGPASAASSTATCTCTCSSRRSTSSRPMAR